MGDGRDRSAGPPPAPSPTSGPAPRRGLHLSDLAAMVVGYGLAALLIRASWPASETPIGGVALMIGLEYLWLGLAMSGPVVLLFERRPAARPGPTPEADRGRPGRWGSHKPDRRRPFDRDFDTLPARSEPPGRYTWAELAWLAIGGYWIGMTVLLASVRLSGAVLPLLALLHLLVIAGFGLVAAKAPASPEARSAWTHKAAVGLLITWPLAWLDLVLMSKTF